MAVASRGAALSAHRKLINRDPVEANAILRRPYLPTGLELSDDPVRMGPSTLIGGYGNEARYTLGAPGFGQAIFNTAMSWRDSLQSALPGYRNRIAQVRTSPGVGGANLFMPREIIASMALRGALAGARLRTRSVDEVSGIGSVGCGFAPPSATSRNSVPVPKSDRGSTRTRSPGSPRSTSRRLTFPKSRRI
jgi:hypothetical protein